MSAVRVRKGMRRSFSRWIRDGELISGTRRWWHAISMRAWYVLVPLLGVAWAEGAVVRPAVSAVEHATDAAKQAALDRVAGLRRQISDARLQAASEAAALEAHYLPRLTHQRAILDSLAQYRRALERDPLQLRAELDSLRAMHERYRNGNDQLRAEQRSGAAIRANLQSWRGSLQDSLVVLERQLARVDRELQRRGKDSDLNEFVGYVWYVVAPCLGAVWVQDS